MSGNICYTDAYPRQTEAVVVEVDPEANPVRLDRTILYPGGGVQPAVNGELVGEGVLVALLRL